MSGTAGLSSPTRPRRRSASWPGYQVFEHYSNPPAEELARRVAELAPLPGAKVFFTPGGGSDAVDTAAKLARSYWRAMGQPAKQVCIGRSHAYHGMNAYGTSLGGIPANTDPFLPLVTEVEHVPWDDSAALDKVDRGAGRGAGRGLLLRAGDRGGRGLPAAGGVPGPGAGYLPAPATCCSSPMR